VARRKKRSLPIFLDKEEQILLIQQPNPRYFTGLRNKVLICLVLDIGIRVSEVVNLKWKHINFRGSKVLVEQGKGQKDRYLYISADVKDELEKWNERQIKQHVKSEYVFTTFKGGQIGIRYIQQMVKRYSEKAGIEKNITPHKLRHTFATDYYKETKDILETGKALGHADVSTTMIYTHVVDDDMENSMKSFQDKRSRERKARGL
jgi:integrase/recombinase XerD